MGSPTDGLRTELLQLFVRDQQAMAELETAKQNDAQLAGELAGRVGKESSGAQMFSSIGACQSWVREGGAPIVVQAFVRQAEEAFDRLYVVAKEHGWPSRAMVGDDGGFAAAAILAHADSERSRRDELLELMREALRRGEVDPRQFGHIVDRVAIIKGDGQVYGTVMGTQSGEARLFWPIADADGVNARRSAIGLPPIEDDLGLFRDGASNGPFLIPIPRT